MGEGWASCSPIWLCPPGLLMPYPRPPLSPLHSDSFVSALDHGHLISWTPGSEVWGLFELLPCPLLPYSVTGKAHSLPQPSAVPCVHIPYPDPGLCCLHELLCPDRFIFLTIKLIHYGQLGIIKCRIKSLIIIVDTLVYSFHCFFMHLCFFF